jgi:hypothetical protein
MFMFCLLNCSSFECFMSFFFFFGLIYSNFKVVFGSVFFFAIKQKLPKLISLLCRKKNINSFETPKKKKKKKN